MKVLTSNGTWDTFKPELVRQSVLRTGASKKQADEVLKTVKAKMHDGISTKELYRMVHDTLRGVNVCYACRYDLREALYRLGPAGYKFEKYVTSILRAHRYDAQVPEEELQGACVRHEVDGIAEKDGRRIFIEAKFRNDYRDYVNLKDVMSTWSRFLDLVDGAAVGKCPHFDTCWIVTNAHFSDRAREFGVCKGMRLVGWSFPKERSFQDMVDIVALYPVTVLDGLTQKELNALAHQHLMLCREVAEIEPDDLARRIDVSRERAEQLITLSSQVISEEPGEL